MPVLFCVNRLTFFVWCCFLFLFINNLFNPLNDLLDDLCTCVVKIQLFNPLSILGRGPNYNSYEEKNPLQ